MKRAIFFLLPLVFMVLPGCGYTTGSLISSEYKTIYIEPFENKIAYMDQGERKVYIPQLEVKVRNAVIDRFMLDGNLKIAEQDNADLVLKGQVLSFERGDLRLTENSDVKEYRLTVIVALTLWNPASKRVVWEEPSFAADTTYYTTGALVKSEATAIQDLMTDLGRRVVARTIEVW